MAEPKKSEILSPRRAEEAARSSEDRIRLIIDTIPVMAWSVEPEGVVDFLNQRWMDYTGLSVEQYVTNPHAPIHPDDIESAYAKWDAVKTRGEPYEDEMRLQSADGLYRWFLVRTAPLRDEHGNIIKWYGVAIDIEDRKQAIERLKLSNQELLTVSARLNSVREEESTRIAREIHDELGGTLSTLKWDLEEVEELLSEEASSNTLSKARAKVAAVIELANNTVRTIRRISSELRPVALDDLGLMSALRAHAQQFQLHTGIAVECHFQQESVNLKNDQSTTIFRIFQEALTNVLRHAGATRVEITSSQLADEFLLSISDNGRGITEEQKSGKRSIGLIGMRERAKLAGGVFEIEGICDKGTLITVRVPLQSTRSR